jgi:transposase
MNQEISVVGIDIAKRVFHVIGMDTRGTIVLRKRLSRGEVVSFMAQLPVFSANTPPGHAYETARQSSPEAGLRADGGVRSAH